MTDTSKEAVEAVEAAPWAFASADISATLRALSAERAMTNATAADLWSDYLDAASSTETDDSGMDVYDIEGMNEAAHDIYLALVAAQAAIDAAVLAEREACAMAIENVAKPMTGKVATSVFEYCTRTAAGFIRNRTEIRKMQAERP